MGTCATKPKDLKEEAGIKAPLPLEEKETKVEDKEDENKRKSLSHLFRESEKRREVSANNGDATVKEGINASQVETKGEQKEETKAPVHPAQHSETARTTETAKTIEETDIPVSETATETPASETNFVEVEGVKEIVENPNVEQKVSVVEEKKDGKFEQKVSVVEQKVSVAEENSAAEKKEDASSNVD
ncbi:uncharacterized protein LOC109823999 [Asparagus officinalis]|uniref:uncharacterized protein LOC109823999 n=1 Tax=Asparagus officinalis TaxID=4686 RepID=UPI00098E1B1B|nr:uncharacterized protein LOC109823999 [Asparagus officinalis]